MSSSTTEPALDLSACDREPIHIPGSIQPHGVLFALEEPSLNVCWVSSNVEQIFKTPLQKVFGHPLQNSIGKAAATAIESGIANSFLEPYPLHLLQLAIGTAENQKFDAIVHRHQGFLILELEETAPLEEAQPLPNLNRLLYSFLNKVRQSSGSQNIMQLAAEEIQRLTGFGRVLVYRFDQNWHGHVLAEAKQENYSSYLDLWFPASDIPQQARRLYELNRVRLIADVAYRPVPILTKAGVREQHALDLSFATLRSVSPVHIEYLKNMGVSASMSVSILNKDGRLWGLIACHNLTARRVSIEIRTVCDFLAQTLSMHLEADEQRMEYERRLRLKSINTQLLSYMAQEENFIQGLTLHPEKLLQFASAQGAAVLHRGRCDLLGETPSKEAVNRLVDWLIENGREEIYATDCLPNSIAAGEIYREKASGLLAISISKLFRGYVLWFRPEVLQSVTWSGDPHKPVEQQVNGSAKISPRKSFESWKEIVHGHSLPWQNAELEAASELRNAVIGIVLRKAEELAALTSELQRSNKELEAFSYSVSHDLRAPFRHIVGFSELLRNSPTAQLSSSDRRYVDTIAKSAQFAGTLVDNLLNYSQVGRAKLNLVRVDVNKLVRQVVQELTFSLDGRVIRWNISDLPEAWADVLMLRTVWQNLLQNAIKYTRTRTEAVIDIRGEAQKSELFYSVKDNGVGFDPAYKNKLFGVFQRLHLMEEFEGTGIGLANVRRIVGRHNGRTWADAELDQGAVFTFTLPNLQGKEIA